MEPIKSNDEQKNTFEHYFDSGLINYRGNIYRAVISDIEKPLLKAALKFTKGNQSRAANILGISRGTFMNLLIKHELLIYQAILKKHKHKRLNEKE